MSPRKSSKRVLSDKPAPWVTYVEDRLFVWRQQRELLEATRSFLTEDSEFYHYTTVEGLKGIVESHSIWATAANYLNDSSEIDYGCTVLDGVCEEWQSANKTTKSNGGRVLDMLRDRFKSKASQLHRAGDVYIACFCEKPNLLSQWRAYGQAGGYSIGFEIRAKGLAGIGSPSLIGVKPEGNDYKARLVRVVYDPAKQRDRLHAVLKSALPQLDEPEALEILSRSTKSEKKGFVIFALLILETFLLEEIVGFKNEAFAEEHEWRIVVSSTTYQVDVPPRGVCFRPARGLVVPYLKIVSTQHKLPIKSVRFGPTLDKSRAENSVRLLCASHGYYSLKIEGSNIPVVL